MAALGITGNARNRLVQAAVLLHMLDPVRGEPTVYGLDQDPHDIESPRERLLKRKFLDSFALVCATKRGGDSVSAACMEEGMPEGTVIRIASNCGVSGTTLSRLREVVDIMGGIASRVHDPSTGEEEILRRIIRLDITKIRHYLKILCDAKAIFEEPVATIESRIMKASVHTTSSTPQQFLEWFRHIFVIRDLPINPIPEALVDHIVWAQKAKRHYLDFLNAAFSSEAQQLPRWIRTIFKLGRYGVASRALAQLASELPALVNPMIVEPVPAPPKTLFTVPEEDIPLTCVLRRAVGSRAEEFISRLASIWNTTDAETHFRRACSLDLVAHAEMQLVNFYEHNQQLRPTFRFIGVSKKSCYLCHLFLATHPDSFSVSSCHQKLYPSWIPPPAVDSRVYKRYKTITTELSKVMEAIVKQDLGSRLGAARRPVPPDSTAGVSLTGLTEPSLTGTRPLFLAGSHVGPLVNEDVVMTQESQSPLHPIEVVSLAPTNLEIDQSISGQKMFSEPTDIFSEHGYSDPISAIVFHFMRFGDASQQDIICVNDILDHSTNCPSWAKLVELLKVDDGFGLAFKEGREFLMVDNRIRVGNERQLLACLQYLRNSNVLNAEVLVWTVDEAAHPMFPKSAALLLHGLEENANGIYGQDGEGEGVCR